MSDDIAIKVEHVGKTFHEQMGARSLKQVFLGIGHKIIGKKEDKLNKGEFTALKDINFEVKKGEFFGIVGRNGCGKSTLLKIIAGVYSPTKGAVTINGKLTPFIELGVGFNPELSGRDNVFLNGALLGFTRKQMEEMYDDIVEFAELKEFMDVKLKNYSSGMQVRLAFSVAIRAESDILLIDEVLAVGDAAFQQKCFEYFMQLKAAHKTVILVTHDMDVVQKFCDSAILIKKGQIVKSGSPTIVSDLYVQENLEQIKVQRALRSTNSRDGALEIVDIKILNSNNQPSSAFKMGDEMIVKCTFKGEKIPEILNFGIALHDSQDTYIFGANTMIDGANTKKMINSKQFQIKYNALPIRDGRYYIRAAIFGNTDQDIYDLVTRGPEFRVLSKNNNQGMFHINHEWK